MKEVKILIGDYEYNKIQEIFENEKDFKPATDNDAIIVQALAAIIHPDNLKAEDVGGPETHTYTVKKIQEPEDKKLEGNVDFSDIQKSVATEPVP